MKNKKEEIIKQLEKLRDIKDYSTSKLMNSGYRTAILDAIDLVNKLTQSDDKGQYYTYEHMEEMHKASYNFGYAKAQDDCMDELIDNREKRSINKLPTFLVS